MDAIVMGGSRGIGRAIAGALSSAGCSVTATSRKELDTSDMGSVDAFCAANPETDILVLNTGGPPPGSLAGTSREDWRKYHDQLFLGMVGVLQGIRIRDGGHAFLISSAVVKEPVPQLVVSAAYRAALAEVFKIYGREHAGRGVSCVGIAPGLTDTDRARELLGDVEARARELPMGRLGQPREIGELVAAIVSRKIKYLSGTTITVDGAASSSAF